MAGCWDLQEAEDTPILPSSICFESASEISVTVMGWGEGFGGDGRYRLERNRIEFSTDLQWEGWLWNDEGQDRFSCELTTDTVDQIKISNCSEGVADATFIRVPADERVRGFPHHRDGTVAEVATALHGCWTWSAQTITDYDNWITMCFERSGLLRVTEDRGVTTLDGFQRAPTMVRDAHYRFEGERLVINRPSGGGWFFHAAQFDCDVVIKPGAKLRLAACNGVRSADGGGREGFSIDLQRQVPKGTEPKP